VQVGEVHKAMQGGYLSGCWGMIALGLICSLNLLIDGEFDLWVLRDTPRSVAELCFWVPAIALNGLDLLLYHGWRLRAKKQAARGEFTDTVGVRPLHMVNLAWSALAIIAMLCLAGSVKQLVFELIVAAVILGVHLLVSWLAKGMQRKQKPSADIGLYVRTILLLLAAAVGVGIFAYSQANADDYASEKARDQGAVGSYEAMNRTFYIYNDPIPLKLEDLGFEVDPSEYSYEMKESGSGSVYTVEGKQYPLYSLDRISPSLEYTIELLTDEGDVEKRVERALKDKEYRDSDPAPWGAEAAYEYEEPLLAGMGYVVVYRDRYIHLIYIQEETVDAVAMPTERMQSVGAAVQEVTRP